VSVFGGDITVILQLQETRSTETNAERALWRTEMVELNVGWGRCC